MRGAMLWGAIGVSVVALVGFAVISALVFTQAASPDLKTVVATAWAGLAGTAVGFWCGSSIGSAQKTELLRDR